MLLPALPNAASIHNAQSPLYFLHIPKTAGTSFKQFLEPHFEPHEICPAHIWRQLIAMPADDVARYRLIWGHFYSFLYRHAPHPVRYVVFLRDPIERALSHYGHILKHPDHYLHHRSLELGSFRAFLLDPETATTVANFQVRSLALDLDPSQTAALLTARQIESGELERRLMTAPFDCPVSDMLESAKRRLLQMSFVGITEKYSESVQLFCQRFKWPQPKNTEVLNVNDNRLRKEDLDPADLQLLLELNQADRELYHLALQLFHQEAYAASGTTNAEHTDLPRVKGSSLSTDIAWELWGARDPYFGVLTDPKFRRSELTPQAKEEFFHSGRAQVQHVLQACRTHLDPAFNPQRVLDFGCGVGRVLIPFAEISKEALGLDVSPSMLTEAGVNCRDRGVTNALLALSDDMLSAAPGQFDLVHSCIVLQHIEVTRGRTLFAHLVEKVRPGGCGAIQVTFGWDVHAATFGWPPSVASPVQPSAVQSLWRGTKSRIRRMLEALGLMSPPPPPPEPAPLSSDPEMQMNFYNFSELMFILQRAGIHRFHAEFTDHGGALGAFVYFQKPANTG